MALETGLGQRRRQNIGITDQNDMETGMTGKHTADGGNGDRYPVIPPMASTARVTSDMTTQFLKGMAAPRILLIRPR